MCLRMLLGVVRTHPLRLILTCLSLATAFLLFGTLQGVSGTMGATLDRMRVDRLLVGRRFNVPLPRAYADEISRVPGVTSLTWTQFLYGAYGGTETPFPVIMTEQDSFFTVRPEYLASAEHRAALRAKPTGIIVLDTLARQHNLKLGQRITVMTAIARKDGRRDWDFEVVGFLSYPENPSQIGFAIGNWTVYDEMRAAQTGTVDRFVLRIKDPSAAATVGKAIDDLFLNSAAPTRTQPENQYGQSQFAVVGDIGRISTWILVAVFGTMLILTGNVITQSVVDRAGEFAMLKAVGYSRARVTTIVFFEALTLCLVGALIGLALSMFVYYLISERLFEMNLAVGQSTPPPKAMLFGLLCAVGLAAFSTLIPELGVNRVKPSAVLNSRA
jgi:putative ABC transport system permease protein